MKIKALTIDFWNTMVVAHTNGEVRQGRRLECLLEVAGACAVETTPEHVRSAYEEAVRTFDASWKDRHCTPAVSELMQGIWRTLALEVDPARHAEAVQRFEEGLLHGPPDLAEGLEEALGWAAGRYRLGIISDTMFSPGRVIRRMLAERGVLDHFDVFVFSDETGFSKPDVRAFERAAAELGVAPGELAHIGDLRRTDVAGARQAGASAVLYTGVCTDADEGPDPHASLPQWSDLPEVLSQLE